MYDKEMQEEFCENLKVSITKLFELSENKNVRLGLLKGIVDDYLISLNFNVANFDYEKYGSMLLNIIKKPIAYTDSEYAINFVYIGSEAFLLAQEVLEEFLNLYERKETNSLTSDIYKKALGNVLGIRELEMPVLERRKSNLTC